MNSHLIAGVLAGIAGLMVFLIIHHIWIMPIWFILPLGLMIAGLGGLAMGWMYAELLPHLPPRPWTAIAVMALIIIILLPATILAELRLPLYDITVPGGRLIGTVGHAVTIFVLELLLTATLVGGLTGWLIGRDGRAAVATAVAGFIFALGPGHNIPFIGGTPGVGKEIAIMTVVIIVSAVVLVKVQARLSL